MKDDIQYLAGVKEPAIEPVPPFSREVLRFLEALSEHIRRTPQLGQQGEIAAFGFWCRKAHLRMMQEGWDRQGDYIGRGLIFHLPPSNVPILFAYSYAVGLLAGNGNVVRISTRCTPNDLLLCRHIRELLEQREHKGIREKTAIITYEHNNEVTQRYLEQCDGRMIWGGDRTIAQMRNLPANPLGVEVVFGDRTSLGVMNMEAVGELGKQEMGELAHRFYNDTYAMDQNACSSPRLLCWVNPNGRGLRGEEIKKRWWEAVDAEAKKYVLEAYKASRKYEMLCEAAMECEEMGQVKRYENRLYVAELQEISEKTMELPAGFGLFYQYEGRELDELAKVVTSKVQTLTFAGYNRKELTEFLLGKKLRGIDRIVPFGKAMEMDIVWDGMDLIGRLAREIR